MAPWRQLPAPWYAFFSMLRVVAVLWLVAVVWLRARDRWSRSKGEPDDLAGPMSGLPQFNYPAFGHAAVTLRGLGYAVLNPADNPLPPCGGTWQGWMRAAITQLVQADAVAFLPGWELSAGATLERDLAHRLAMPCMRVDDIGPCTRPAA